MKLFTVNFESFPRRVRDRVFSVTVFLVFAPKFWYKSQTSMSHLVFTPRLPVKISVRLRFRRSYKSFRCDSENIGVRTQLFGITPKTSVFKPKLLSHRKPRCAHPIFGTFTEIRVQTLNVRCKHRKVGVDNKYLGVFFVRVIDYARIIMNLSQTRISGT